MKAILNNFYLSSRVHRGISRIFCLEIPRQARNDIFIRSIAFRISIFVFVLISTSAWADVVSAKSKSITGTVTFALPGQPTFAPLKVGQELPVGSVVKTGSDGVAILVTVPGAAVRVGPDSNLTLSELEFQKTGEKITKRKAMLDLKTGTLSALIEHNTPDVTDFKIKTPQGIAAARGTFYGVTIVDGKTHVAVQEGKVGIQDLK